MKRHLLEFFTDDDGAITVDWVVLTAAVMLMSVALIAAVKTGSEEATAGINDDILASTSSD